MERIRIQKPANETENWDDYQGCSSEGLRAKLFSFAADDYMDQGLSVIPILPRSKKPAVKWKNYQTKYPTRSEIDNWWRQNPNYELGILTGSISNLMVIDFDSEEAIPEFVKNIGLLPETITQKTNRGVHRFYQCPPSFKSRPAIIKDVDIKAEGGYILVEPSRHSSGTGLFHLIFGPALRILVTWPALSRRF